MSSESQNRHSQENWVLPVGEILTDTVPEPGLVTRLLSASEIAAHGWEIAAPNGHMGEVPVPPSFLVERFGMLKYQSHRDGFTRFGTLAADGPYLTILVGKIDKTADEVPEAKSDPDDGFDNLPDLDSGKTTNLEAEEVTPEEGFEDLPDLNSNKTAEIDIRWPGFLREKMTLTELGPVLGVVFHSSETFEDQKFIAAEVMRGMPLLTAFAAADPFGKLILARELVRVVRESFQKGMIIEAARLSDFVTSGNVVGLAHLGCLAPRLDPGPADDVAHFLLAPETVPGTDRRLQNALYSLGSIFMALIRGAELTPADMCDHGKSLAWWRDGDSFGPECGRLLGCLLAADPDMRLGRYQGCSETETWDRIDAMLVDWLGRPPRPEFRFVGKTTTGVYRENNEDSFGIVHSLKRGVGHGRHLFLGVLSDGMGGGALGEIASTIAVESMVRSFDRAVELFPNIGVTSLKLAPDGGYVDQGPAEVPFKLISDGMGDWLTIAHFEILEAARKGGESCEGMGATAVAFFCSEWRAVIGHVGDSRAYLIRAGTIRQLTEDHSAVQRLVKSGLISNEEAAHHPRRHELSQALGGHTEPVPEVLELIPLPGDAILLCSDGVTNVLANQELLSILGSPDQEPHLLVNRLLHEVNARGGPDNATAVLVQIR